MFSRNTAHAAHNTRNSNALRNAEEEFGSLKRHLERREAQRRGIIAHVPDGADGDPSSGIQRSHDAVDVGAGKSPSDVAALANVLGATARARPEAIPLFADEDATMDIVKTAHRKHNRAILVHNAQWDAAHSKMISIVETTEAAHRELDDVISTAKEAQNSDPPAIESSTCNSNYMGIREHIRHIAAAGNHIDSSDTSPNDFEFLFSDATLTSREKVMLQRIRDLSAKLKSLTATHASTKEAAAQEKSSFDAQLHDLKEQQREMLEEKQREWDEHREILESDVQHWKDSSASLQGSLDAARQQIEREREAAAAVLATTLSQHKEEVGKWMQTVAAGDREMHRLRESTKEMESRLSGSTQVLEQLQEELRATAASLATVTASRDTLVMDQRRLEAQLEHVSEDVKTLRAAKPEVVDADIQVDTNTIIADLRDSLSSARSELSRLRLNNDHFLKLNTSLEAELRSAVTFKGMYEQSEKVLQRTSQELATVSKQRHRDHKRRLELVCENFSLRALILVLQRPNGFGERMENLQAENRWLMDKLQRRVPLHIQTHAVVAPSSSSIDLRTEETERTGSRVLVQRHADDEHSENERDVVLHVADASTQTWLRETINGALQHVPAMWKSVATMCTEASIQNDLMEVATVRQASMLAQYVSSSETRHMIESSTGKSRAIQMASQRFRRALAADDVIDDEPIAEDDDSDSDGGARSPLYDVAKKTPSTQRHASANGAFKPPRPNSAQSFGGWSVSSSTQAQRSANTTQPPPTQQHPSTRDESVLQDGAREASPQLCVFGVRDAPQKSALTGTPTQYFTMKRSLGLVGAIGKQREMDLHLHNAMERAVVIEEPIQQQQQQHRGVSSLPSTMPIRTIGEPRPTSAFHGAKQQLAEPSSSVRPRSALVARSTSPMSSFMPTQRAALGSWKPKVSSA
ncbi:Hypothetical protein, putative [Bodo saltans]|uniref:Uncharacterized protein n=1 Tax=Bodo saltans TaxID=75058 RepID=A0A0S4J3I7_BODSA|nr:Hypothetical protein, putative [Bodo saltans]|eukprot:CUG07755.1 Hypothetical protein, putative [Bodo saltans]